MMNKRPKRTITKICSQCGDAFTRPDNATWRKSVYCSIDCYAAYRRSLPPEERAALMTNATSTIRGSKRSHDDLCKRARTKQERAELSGDEAIIMAGFIGIGLHPIPLYAVDKFNIDFAFPAERIAIEYHGGNWHNTAAKRMQDERKRRYLESIGWTYRAFPRIDKPQNNDAGNERITVDELVSEVKKMIHSASPIKRRVEDAA